MIRAALKKLHKLARVLVRVQLSHDLTALSFSAAKGFTWGRSFVLSIRLGAGAGYMWPRFFKLSGCTFFIALRPKNWHIDPHQFSRPWCVRVTRNGNGVPVPDGAGTWSTLDLF